MRDQEVTPHKPQSIWNPLKWFSSKFGILGPDSIERLKLKRKTIQESLVETTPFQGNHCGLGRANARGDGLRPSHSLVEQGQRGIYPDGSPWHRPRVERPETNAAWSILKADVIKARRRIKITQEGWKYQVAQLEANGG